MDVPCCEDQYEDEYVPLDRAAFPVTVSPVLGGWLLSPAAATARAAAFGVGLFRHLRYNVEEIYEDAGNGREKGRIEYDPHVYMFALRGPLRFLRLDAWIDRTGGESALCLHAFGYYIEVYYAGRSDTVPYAHPTKH